MIRNLIITAILVFLLALTFIVIAVCIYAGEYDRAQEKIIEERRRANERKSEDER